MKSELRWLGGCALAALLALPAACSSDSGEETETEKEKEKECGGFLDEAPQAEVTVRIRNEGAAPVFLFGADCTSDIDVLLTDPVGNERWHRSGACVLTCEYLQEGEIYDCSCGGPPAIKVAPGGVYETNWTGTYREERVMPDSCYLDPAHTLPSCPQNVAAPAGDYVVGVRGYATIDCYGSGACDCTADANGVCELDGDPTGDVALREAQVSFPTDMMVEIVFD